MTDPSGDDRHDTPANHPDPDSATEVFTGDPVDALFQVETSGEDDEEPAEGQEAPTGADVVSFAIDPQLGETIPPELRMPTPLPLETEELDLEADIELDPTDPGFTADDLAAMPPEARDEPAPVEVESADRPDTPRPPAQEVDWDKLASQDYVGSSTSEYQGLAAEVSRTRHEELEQSAVSASMPGMDAGLVGLEDVTGRPAPPADVERTGHPDLGIRIVTGVLLMALFLGSLLWPAALAVLAIVVFGLAASEFYAVLVRTGHHPLSVFGLLGVAGCLVGAWIWGATAIPVALIATVIAIALFYGTTAPRANTLRDASLTLLGTAWIGGFGALALPIITSEDYGWLIAGVVLIVVALDVGQYFTGRRLGKRPLAPVVSPKKTVEGLVGGALLAILVAAGLSFFGPFDRFDLLLLAVAAIVMGPIGDLAVSSIKRRIGVKDMGIVLPGHGGILDRIDALLFVIPAAWVVYNVTGLII